MDRPSDAQPTTPLFSLLTKLTGETNEGDEASEMGIDATLGPGQLGGGSGSGVVDDGGGGSSVPKALWQHGIGGEGGGGGGGGGGSAAPPLAPPPVTQPTPQLLAPFLSYAANSSLHVDDLHQNCVLHVGENTQGYAAATFLFNSRGIRTGKWKSSALREEIMKITPPLVMPVFVDGRALACQAPGTKEVVEHVCELVEGHMVGEGGGTAVCSSAFYLLYLSSKRTKAWHEVLMVKAHTLAAEGFIDKSIAIADAVEHAQTRCILHTLCTAFAHPPPPHTHTYTLLNPSHTHAPPPPPSPRTQRDRGHGQRLPQAPRRRAQHCGPGRRSAELRKADIVHHGKRGANNGPPPHTLPHPPTHPPPTPNPAPLPSAAHAD